MVDLSLIRTPLFVPGHRPDRFAKAAASGADGLILDLEDAVPTADKDSACAALAVDFTALPVLVLIESAEGLAAARSIAAGGAARLVFGSIDFCADLGAAHERDVLSPVRSELVLASGDGAVSVEGAMVDEPVRIRARAILAARA